MDCRETGGLLNAYLDGEATQDERGRIEAHLAGCKHCREELESLSATHDLLRQAFRLESAQLEESSGSWEKLRQRIEAGSASISIWESIWEKLSGIAGDPVFRTAAAMLLLLALVGIFAGRVFFMGFGASAPASAPPPSPAVPALTRAAPTTTVPSVTRAAPATTQPPPPVVITIPPTTEEPHPSPQLPPGVVPPGPISKQPGATWSVNVQFDPSSTSYMPGEEAIIGLSLTNESAGPVVIQQFPPEISIVLPGTGNVPLPGMDSIVLHTFPAGTGQRELAAGENVTCNFTWGQKDSTGKQVTPGWYFVEYNLKLANKAEPVMEWGTGGRERLLLIQYPQGAMEKIIEMEQWQEVTGLSFTVNNEVLPVDLVLTLKQVELSRERASFFVLLTSPNNPLPGYEAPPIRTIRIDAQYIIDGVVKNARSGNRQATEGGVEVRFGYNESYLDPVPCDAKELTFVITRIGDREGRWEFNIPLAP